MKIALIGYGKMGRQIEKVAVARGHEIVLRVNSENREHVSSVDLQKADVAIEFTAPSAVLSNINWCHESSIPVVTGTTGWYEKLEEVRKECLKKNGTIVWASNFSLGVNIFFRLNEQLASLMKPYQDYKPSIREIHHTEKKDSPSGTAITLANSIIENLPQKKKWVNEHTDTPEELEVISIRENNVPGTHVVKYSSAIDDIEISHTAHNREGFALGAVLAAEFAKGKKGVFTMSDVLNF